MVRTVSNYLNPPYSVLFTNISKDCDVHIKAVIIRVFAQKGGNVNFLYVKLPAKHLQREQRIAGGGRSRRWCPRTTWLRIFMLCSVAGGLLLVWFSCRRGRGAERKAQPKMQWLKCLQLGRSWGYFLFRLIKDNKKNYRCTSKSAQYLERPHYFPRTGKVFLQGFQTWASSLSAVNL